MRLLIKQRVFSWTDSYDIYDEIGNKKYTVKAEFLSLGHQLHVYDMSDCEVGTVKQRILTFRPIFDVEIGGNVIGCIRRDFSFFIPKYEIDYKGWYCEGDFLQWNYDAFVQEEPVVHISKKILNWGDTYVLDIVHAEDEIMAIMLAVAIDAANCSSNDN